MFGEQKTLLELNNILQQTKKKTAEPNSFVAYKQKKKTQMVKFN